MDTRELWIRFSNGDDDARQQLLTQHVALVHFVARQVARGLGVDLEFDELVSAGTIGLISALERFDPARGLAFSTFATPSIRGAILDEFRRQDHVPRSIRRKSRAINSAQDELSRANIAVPSDRETAEHLNVDLTTLWRWRAEIEGAVHLPFDQGAPENEGRSSLADMLFDPDEDGIEQQITHSKEVELLHEAIGSMKEQQRIVLSLYYFEELKLHEIATILELTESRVSQIRSKALANLRRSLAPLRQDVA